MRPAAAEGLTALSTAPTPMNLPFAPGRFDYVARCPGNQNTTLSGTVGAGMVVRARPLGANPSAPSVQSGSFQITLNPPNIRGVRLDVTTTTSTRPVATYRVRCLMAGFPNYTASVTGTPQGEFYLVNQGNWVLVFNADGTPVWWSNDAATTINAKVHDGLLVSGLYSSQACPTTPNVGATYRVRRWDGTVVRQFTSSLGLDNHDLVWMPNGDVVGFQCVNSDRGLSEEARLVALDEDGQEVWSWRTEDHLTPEEQVAAPWKFGYAHVNAVEPDGNSAVLVSPRNLDAIYDIDMATGEVRWKLGGTATPASLSVSDGDTPLTTAEVEDLFSGQHDARIWPDGSVTVFDNGTDGGGRLPRLLRFTLDLEERHATLVEQVRDPRAIYSWGLGSARRLSGGNWAAAWGGNNTFVSEVDPTGAPVLTITGMSGAYRFVPAEHGEIDADALREGMDARQGAPNPSITVTVPEEGATFGQGDEVDADFDCVDQSGGSGITVCSGAASVDTSTLGPHQFTVTATDGAAHTTTETNTYTVEDRTDPTVTLTTPADGQAFAQDEVVASAFSCDDDTAVATCAGPSSVDTSTLGEHDFTVTATDTAGNDATVTHSYTIEDRTDPTITLTTPAAGQLFAQDEVVASSFSCDDDTAVATCVGPSSVDTSTLGEHEFTVTATDTAGNDTTVTHSYTVAVARPDARIRDGSGLVGDDVYGGDQRLTRTGARAVFTVSAQNDAPFPDGLRVSGPGSTATFRVRYLVRGVDVTARVVGGTYETAELAPGAAEAVRVEVSARNTAPRHAAVTRRVVVSSSTHVSRRDAVRLVLRRF